MKVVIEQCICEAVTQRYLPKVGKWEKNNGALYIWNFWETLYNWGSWEALYKWNYCRTVYSLNI